MENYSELVNELKQLQKDRAAEVGELIFLTWINACLRHQLMRNHEEEEEQQQQNHYKKSDFESLTYVLKVAKRLEIIAQSMNQVTLTWSTMSLAMVQLRLLKRVVNMLVPKGESYFKGLKDGWKAGGKLDNKKKE